MCQWEFSEKEKTNIIEKRGEIEESNVLEKVYRDVNRMSPTRSQEFRHRHSQVVGVVVRGHGSSHLIISG